MQTADFDYYLPEDLEKGVKTAFVTLHVGLGTFRPGNCLDIAEHVMHREYYVGL